MQAVLHTKTLTHKTLRQAKKRTRPIFPQSDLTNNPVFDSNL